MDVLTLQSLLGEFTLIDIALVLSVSLSMSALIAWIYTYTHRGMPYSSGFIRTLVVLGMIVALVMVIIGSNVARAFALMGALSVIRFRNIVKDALDVEYIFFVMVIGMTVGVGLYLLGVAATLAVCLVILLMTRGNWFVNKATSLILRVQVPDAEPFGNLFDPVFLRYTHSSELISVESLQGGSLTELTYSVVMNIANQAPLFLAGIKALNHHNKATLSTGYLDKSCQT
jgi:hypothetical protein